MSSILLTSFGTSRRFKFIETEIDHFSIYSQLILKRIIAINIMIQFQNLVVYFYIFCHNEAFETKLTLHQHNVETPSDIINYASHNSEKKNQVIHKWETMQFSYTVNV